MAIEQATTKVCTRCDTEKPLSDFGRHKGKDHANPACRECNNARGRAWYGDNKEARQSTIKTYAEAHKDERREYGANYYQENRERLDPINAAWYKANPEVRNAVVLADYHKNPEAYQERNKRWREENPETAAAICRQFRIDNPDLIRAHKRNDRARRRNAEGSHTAEDIQNLYRLQRGKCALCFLPLGDTWHVDHTRPLKPMNPQDEPGTNDRSNLQLVHDRCNLEKRNKDPITDARKRGRLL